MKRLLLLVATVGLAMTAACGGGSGSSGSDAGSHNDADVAFAQDMVPHHEQAVDMAEMALQRSARNEVKRLASQIKEAQGPEIEKMKGWLAEWNAPVQAAGGGHSGMSMGGAGSTEGMMSDGEMAKLMAASGPAFDRLFLEGMIEHHQGAVAMAKVEIKEGKFADAKALAQAITKAQEAEIAEMQSLITRS